MDSTFDKSADDERDEQDASRTTFQSIADVELGRTILEDKDTGEEIVQYKARAHGETGISDDPMAAVMGCLDKLAGVEL